VTELRSVITRSIERETPYFRGEIFLMTLDDTSELSLLLVGSYLALSLSIGTMMTLRCFPELSSSVITP
jgi:hypothetical protein